MVTAKDKLRLLLSNGLDYSGGRAIAFSSERADKATKADNGIDNVTEFVGMGVPDVYSAGLSEFVFAAGVKLVETFRPDVMYLSTTDYIQHKAAPGSKIANDFYAMIDGYLARLDALGCVVVATADHGMNDKHLADGSPDVLYLEPLFDGLLGAGKARVILPITDPYVAHHGALGSFATVYVPPGTNVADLTGKLRATPGIERVLSREEACAEFELPPDRLGDIVVISTRHKTLGTAAGQARSVGFDRAAALARRAHRAARSDDLQSQDQARPGSSPAHVRCVLRRAQQYVLRCNHECHDQDCSPHRIHAHRGQACLDR